MCELKFVTCAHSELRRYGEEHQHGCAYNTPQHAANMLGVCQRLLLKLHALWVAVACRGIDVVRNKIKMFAQKKVTLPPGRHKIVILDEADR